MRRIACPACGETKNEDKFVSSNNPFFRFGKTPICAECIGDLINKKNGDLQYVNKICQWIDVPFFVDKWTEIYETNGKKAFLVYSEIFKKKEYDGVDWSKTNSEYKEALERGDNLKDKLPLFSKEKKEELYSKWGQEYDDTDFKYLERLYDGLVNTYNITGALQIDQAVKLCKLSLIMDERIEAGEDFKGILDAYDKIIKEADFTPKNLKNAGDFDSAGEVFAFLEKKGHLNTFYDGNIRDEVDATIKNIQGYLRNLYLNESGIPEDIEKKLEALNNIQELENDYDGTQVDFDSYDKEAYDIIKGEEFDPGR